MMETQQLRAFRDELTKEAFLGEFLGSGLLGHILVNRGGRQAHHLTNLAEVMAHKGFQHGASGARTSWGAMRSMKQLAGPESTVAYEAAHKAGKLFYELPPHVRAAAAQAWKERGSLAGVEGAEGLMQHLGNARPGPVTEVLGKAFGHELAGTAPTLQTAGSGITGRAYAHAVNRLSNVTTNEFSTTGQKIVNNAVGAAPWAALAATHPAGTAGHTLVNAGREVASQLPMGKQWIADDFKRGLHGEQLSPTVEKIIDHAISPAVLDGRREALAMRRAGVTPEQFHQNMQNAQTAVNSPLAAQQAARFGATKGLEDTKSFLGEAGRYLGDVRQPAPKSMMLPTHSIAPVGGVPAKPAARPFIPVDR